MKHCLTLLKVLTVTASMLGIVLLTLPTLAQTPSADAQILRLSFGIENKASFPDIIANNIFVAVAYVQDETVYIRSATQGNGWVERVQVGPAGRPPQDKEAAGGQPRLVFRAGSFDEVYVIWFDKNTNKLATSLCQLATDSSPDCSPPRTISVNLTGRFDATIANDGTVYAVAVRSDSNPDDNFLEVFSMTGNSWSLQATLRQGQVITSPQSPAIAASDNFLHLAFSNNQRKSISYYRYPLGQAGATWALQKQYDLSRFADHSEVDRPDIIVNGSTVYMAWDARRNPYFDASSGEQVDDAYGLIFAASVNEGQTWPDVATFALSKGRLTNETDEVDDRRIAQAIKQDPLVDIPAPFEKVGLQPSMALSGTGVVLAWQQRPQSNCNRRRNGSSEIYTAFYDGTVWGKQTAVNNNRSLYDIDPSIAVGPGQKPHLVYMESAVGSTCGKGGEQADYAIYYQGPIVTSFDPNVGEGTPTPQPILALSKTGPETVTLNSLITYTLIAANGGDRAATTVEIIDTVPAGTQYVSGGTLSGTDVRWQLNELAANKDEVVSYVVRAVEAITVTSNNYRLTASGGYSATGKTTVETKVIPLQTVKEPSLDIIKSADRFEADIGTRITYTLRIFNNGDGEATNLVVTDTLPTGAVYVSGGTRVGNDIRWDIPTLAAGQLTSVSFVVAAGQTVTNTNYQVTAAGGYQDIGDTPIVTVIETNQACVPGKDEGCPPIDGTYTAYLPTLLKN